MGRILDMFQKALSPAGQDLMDTVAGLCVQPGLTGIAVQRNKNMYIMKMFSIGATTWNTYASSTAGFFEFINRDGIHPHDATAITIGDYVADTALTGEFTLSPTSLRQGVSGVRAILRALGTENIPRGNQDPYTSGAIKGYERMYLLLGRNKQHGLCRPLRAALKPPRGDLQRAEILLLDRSKQPN